MISERAVQLNEKLKTWDFKDYSHDLEVSFRSRWRNFLKYYINIILMILAYLTYCINDEICDNSSSFPDVKK